jgi:hypothetical protein
VRLAVRCVFRSLSRAVRSSILSSVRRGAAALLPLHLHPPPPPRTADLN